MVTASKEALQMTNPKTVPATPAPRASRAKPAQVAAPGAVVQQKTSMTAWVALAAVVMLAIIIAAWKFGPIGSDNPALGSSEPSKAVAVSQSAVVAPVDHVAKASAVATVVCDKDNTQTAKAIGKTASAVATCGNTKPAVRVAKAPAKAPAKASVAHAAPAGMSAETVRRMADENIARRIASGVKTTSAAASSGISGIPRFPEEGKVYSDAEGNTFERHTGGSRLCKFFVNGELVSRKFVQDPDPRKSKAQCDLLAAEFIAGLTPTTPEAIVAAAPQVAQAPQAVVASAGSGNHTCNLTFDGKIVETVTTIDDAACKVWTRSRGKEKGWIPK